MRSAAASLLSSRYVKPFAFFYAGVFLLLFLYLHGTTHPDAHTHQGHHVRGIIDHRIVAHEGHHVQRVDIPKIIHQTWKSKDLPSGTEYPVQSWKEKNPGYEYRFYTDDDMDKMVAEDHPELVPLWKRMTGVLKADFFRYLVLFKYGGYYADIDVTCNTPIDDWFRYANVHHAAGLVVGFEIITGRRPDWYKWFSRKFQLCQWTMGGVPGHPIFARTIDHIWAMFDKHKDKKIDAKQAVQMTGPAVWSDGITDFLKDEYGVEFGEPPYSDVRLRDEFVLVGDVLLMPMRTFGVGSAGYAFPYDQYPVEHQFVTHGFQGSWKAGHVEMPRHEPPNLDREYCSESYETGATLCTYGHSPPGEDLKNLLDGKKETKWLQYRSFKDGRGESYVIIKAPEGQRFAPTQLSLVSAHDEPEGDPSSWKLYGHAENDQWDLLLSVDAHKFDERLETVVFPISPKQNGQYSQFKLLITKIRDADKADHVHLAELTLEGMPAPSPPETVCVDHNDVRICACCTVQLEHMKDAEGPIFAFDGSVLTKWHIQWEQSNFYPMHPTVSITLPRAIGVIGYNMSSANDFPQRDPSSWNFAVRNTDTEPWRTVDRRSEFVFEERYQNATFQLKEPVTARQFLWNITGLADPYDVHCSHRYCTQISELRLLPLLKGDAVVLPDGQAAREGDQEEEQRMENQRQQDEDDQKPAQGEHEQEQEQGEEQRKEMEEARAQDGQADPDEQADNAKPPERADGEPSQ